MRVEAPAVHVGEGDEHVGLQDDDRLVLIVGLERADAVGAAVGAVGLADDDRGQVGPLDGGRDGRVGRQGGVVRHEQPVLDPGPAGEGVRHRAAGSGPEVEPVAGARLALRLVPGVRVRHADHEAITANRDRRAKGGAGRAAEGHDRSRVPRLAVRATGVHERAVGIGRADDHAGAGDVEVGPEARGAGQVLHETPREAFVDVDVDGPAAGVRHEQRARGPVVVRRRAEPGGRVGGAGGVEEGVGPGRLGGERGE